MALLHLQHLQHLQPTAAPTQFALALLHEVAATGNDPDALLMRAGLRIDKARLEASHHGGISDHQFTGIYRECITLLSVQANRERNLPPMSKDEVDLLCYCVIGCTNLRAVIERARRFCAMLGARSAELGLEPDGDEVAFQMATQRLRDSASALLTDLNGLAFYHRLVSWLIGETIAIGGYRIYASAMVEPGILQRFFQQTILFEQPVNSFSFSPRLLDKPVIRTAQQLEEVLRLFPFDHMRDPHSEGIADAVDLIVQRQLSAGQPIPTLEQFARFFNMSRATFQRRLRKDGVSLEETKKRLRSDLAQELLHPDAGLKVGDVAQRLGFSDVRSFRRAFIDWHGISPDAWRRQQS